MATRHYTEEAYEQIKQTIEQIDSADVNPVMDFFGDLFQRIGQFLEIFKVEDYQNDMQKWYNKVLDSHNTTLNKVESIFNDVESVDFEYRDIMKGVLDSIVDFQSTLDALRDVISRKTTLSEGQATAKKYLNSGKNALNHTYDTILTKMEQGTLWDASMALIGDAVALGACIVKCKLGGNAADYKKLADTALATACDLRAMLSFVDILMVGVSGQAVGMEYEDYLDYRFKQLTKAKKLKDTDSISDLLGNLAEDMDEQVAKCPEDSPVYPVLNVLAEGTEIVANTADTVDIVADVYGLYKDTKDIFTNIKEWKYGKDYTQEEYTELFKKKDFGNILSISKGDDGLIVNAYVPPTEIVKQIISERSGIPLSGWSDPQKFDGNGLKVLSTLWSYGEKLIPDPVSGKSKVHEIPDIIFDKIKDIKYIKDIIDINSDTNELLSQVFST